MRYPYIAEIKRKYIDMIHLFYYGKEEIHRIDAPHDVYVEIIDEESHIIY